MSLQHCINVAGFIPPAPLWKRLWRLRRGAPVTVVQWNGCMADVRQEVYRGTIIKQADQREKFGPKADKIDCLVIHKPDGSEDWQPSDRIRFVGKSVEVWT